MTRRYNGQLEVDPERGVIYFHSSETGTSLLRIQALPTPIPRLPGEIGESVFDMDMLDINLGQSMVSWREEPVLEGGSHEG